MSLGKARIIANATALMDPNEARAAEAGVLDRAGRLTPGSLRAAIARAVMEAAPDKARKRRETAARFARVERWAEDSGNAALAGRELPPDQVLAVDDRITWWAGELRTAGLDGGTDEIRARAYLDLLLGTDSRPGGSRPAGSRAGQPGAVPAGFASRVTLTVPLATLAGLAGRPGELSGLGPVDPWLARDLAAAAAANPKTTWCLTVTDNQGHALAHGCARPEPKTHRQRAGPGPPGFRFTPASRDGPPGGYGSWRLRTPGPGPGLIITLDPVTTDPCDHRHETSRPRPRGQAEAPVPGPARHLHQPRLPPARRPVRPRAQHPLRSRRPHLSVQHRPEVPSRPPPQAAPQVESRPAPRRHLPMDHPVRPVLRPPNPRATRSKRAETRRPEDPEALAATGRVHVACTVTAALCYARLRLLLSAVRRRKVTARLKVSRQDNRRAGAGKRGIASVPTRGSGVWAMRPWA